MAVRQVGSSINTGQNLWHASGAQMTAYKKNLLAWACIMALGFASGLAALYTSNWFVVPFVAIIYSAQFVVERITCPNCGTPVTYQGNIAGFRIRGGFFRKKCQQCGWDLGKNL